jgi:beta-lactamase regulating signal transducer with metallopeptidase domain
MLPLLLESAVRALAVCGVAALGIRLFRVRTPQVRHLIWTVVLVASLAMPAISELLRDWSRPVTPPPVLLNPVQQLVTIHLADTKAAPPATTYWLELYLAVTGVLLLRLLVGLFLTWRIARRAAVWDGRVRISAEVRGPVSFARTVLLPESYKDWKAEERQAVLRHEFAHCARGDFFVQMLAKLHRAVFWFNPMAWWLDRHLADLAEQACDDAAVQSRMQCPAYAELLVRFAAPSEWHTAEAGVAMARVTSVSRRIDRLLDAAFEPGRSLSPKLTLRLLASLVPLALLPALFHLGMQAQDRVQQTPSRADRRSFAITGAENRIQMSGDTRDIERIRRRQAEKGGKDILWIRDNGIEYVIDDEKIVREARGLFHTDAKVEAEMEALGRKQEELGKLQEELGARQERVKVDIPDFDEKVLQRLVKRLAELKANKTATQEELAEIQGELGDLQGTLGEMQARAGSLQADLGGKQAELGEKQAKLGERQAELGERVAREAEKATARLNQMIDKLMQEGKAVRVR